MHPPSPASQNTISPSSHGTGNRYSVDASVAEPLPWGRDAGCAFALQGCGGLAASPAWARDGYLCDQPQQAGCSYDRRAEAYCDLRRYGQPFPPPLRHFDTVGEEDLGGYSSLLDYCPVFRPYANGNCEDDSGSWQLTSEARCPACRCFEKGDAFGYRVSSCFRSRCLNASTLEVSSGGRWLRCPPEGGRVPVGGSGPVSAVNTEGGGGGSATPLHRAGAPLPRGILGWPGVGWGQWYETDTLECPPAVDLCATDAAIWQIGRAHV